MTRKRYIKLVMSTGKDRNTAAAMAKEEREDKFPYAAGWAWYKAFTTPPPGPDGVEVVQTPDGPVITWEVAV